MLYVARTSSSASLAIDTGLAQVTLLTQPQDATVVEGGDVTFQCAVEEKGMALLFRWDVILQGGMPTTVTTGTPVAGVSMVTISDDGRQLTLSGVQREVDGATVVCTALASTSDVESNPATITVQCRYMHAMTEVYNFHHLALHYSLLLLFTTHMQTLLCTDASQTSPPLRGKENTSPIPLCLLPTHVPSNSPGTKMARSSSVVVG